MKHWEQTFAIYVYIHCNILMNTCNIPQNLQHTSETSETLETYACNMCFRVSSSARRRAERRMVGSGQPAAEDGGTAWQRPAVPSLGLGLAEDGGSTGNGGATGDGGGGTPECGGWTQP